MTNERPNPSFLFAVQFQKEQNSKVLDGENAVKKQELGGRENAATEKRKKKPYKELTLEEKVELIRLAERCTNLSQANIAEKYEIAKSNVCRILQRKEEYIRALESAGFSGSRKRKLRALGNEEEREKEKEGKKEREKQRQNAEGLADRQLGGGEGEGDGGGKGQTVKGRMNAGGEEDNEALRAHMASEHQNGRVFLCRCCNWAFRDKNELHRHLKSRRSKEQPKGVEEGPKANSERSPIRVPFNQPSLLPSPPQDRHHLLMTNLWNNILLGQCRLQDFTAANEEDVSGRGQELPPILQPPPPMPIPSSVIVQNVAANNNISMSQSSQTGLSPSESDTELTIISSSSSSSSSHNNSHTISPSQSCSSSSAKNVPLIDQICQPPNSVSPECPQCALVKPKLALVQTRCSYLEVYNGTMQNELVRLNAKCILAEQCIRRLEMELRQWRERNDLLRYRLLECREKALSMVAGGTANGAHLELNKFVGEMLKITLV